MTTTAGPQVTASTMDAAAAKDAAEVVVRAGLPIEGPNVTLSDYNVLVVALSVIQNEVTHDCRRAATLILSGFLVVGILLIIPAIMQTAAAYLWIEQYRKQLHHQPLRSASNDKYNKLSTVFHKKNVTDMTRTLFIYRILACVASLMVLICSTLPQLVLVVANPPNEGNIDQRWGWCQTFVYMDHVTRSFATYLIVVPYVLFFWDFLFSEVVPRRHLVMKHIFRGVLISSMPIALFSSMIAVPLVVYRYERMWDGVHEVCSSSIRGTTNFLVFDFAITRVVPAVIIIIITAAFLVWLPRDHYGVFYEPLIFLFLMAPVVFLEATIYIASYLGKVHNLVNEHFANILLIFYALYHMSFSSTFVLETIRSVVTEIRQERKARKRFLLGENPKGDVQKSDRRSNVMLGLQRQFSVVFRWRSECAEDELHLEESILGKQSEVDIEAIPIPEETSKSEAGEKKHHDDVTMHYSILQRSATYKREPKPSHKHIRKPSTGSLANAPKSGPGHEPSPTLKRGPLSPTGEGRGHALMDTPGKSRSRGMSSGARSLRKAYTSADMTILPSHSPPRNGNRSLRHDY
ncbi:unnamed protein product [Mesocestoides corti]|uniref:G_PROTEIN_RECEP_F1_2 domain-containing protein n=1 Tax=Mesocestoides corti TaxID=53468 RepID=A0A0R3UEA3_MESCO|nr:unnamed protein product [Mesocestoides corti]